jgi:hypothetical protein
VAPQFLIVSPFRGAEKHPANPIAIEQRFLNFGALSLASFLARLGWETRVYDEYVNVGKQNTIQRLTEDFGNDSPLLIGVSVISAYSADRVQDLLHSLKATWPGVPIAIGGQHFVGYWTNRFKEYMPDADMLVAGSCAGANKSAAGVAVLDSLSVGVGGGLAHASRQQTHGFCADQQGDVTHVVGQLGVGGGIPTPRKASEASIRIATDDRITTCTKIGLQALGSTVRNML